MSEFKDSPSFSCDDERLVFIIKNCSKRHDLTLHLWIWNLSSIFPPEYFLFWWLPSTSLDKVQALEHDWWGPPWSAPSPIVLSSPVLPPCHVKWSSICTYPTHHTIHTLFHAAPSAWSAVLTLHLCLASSGHNSAPPSVFPKHHSLATYLPHGTWSWASVSVSLHTRGQV